MESKTSARDSTSGHRSHRRVRRGGADLQALTHYLGAGLAGRLQCLAASVSSIYMDGFLARRGIDPIVLSACQLLAAPVMLAIALAVSGARTPHIAVEGVAAVAVLGVVGAGFAYVLNHRIITSEEATIASTVTYLLPVVAIMLGVLVLGENITVTALAGAALVLLGVALTRTKRQLGRGQEKLPPR